MSAERSPLVEVVAGGVRWHVPSEHAERLLGPHGLRLEDWLRDGHARIVKHGPHRTVYQVALSGLSFYLKHFRLNDARAWLRQLVRPAKARMEFDRALGVASREVPTIVPIGVGVACAGAKQGDSFLVTHTLENVTPLDTFIEAVLPNFNPRRLTRIRLRLAHELGELLARIHDSGVLHRDLHAANILVRLDPGDKIQLFLVDLHAVRLRKPLDWTVSRENLVILNRWFSLRVGRSERLRFWRAYCEARPALTSMWHRQVILDAAKDVETRTWDSNRVFWRHRDRRCRANNRYYQRIRGHAAVGYAVRDLDRRVIDGLLADPDEPFGRSGITVIKDSRSATVIELEIDVGGEAKHVIYKRFRLTSALDPWAALVRRSPAVRSWIFGHGLRERGLPTARPLAVMHRRRHGIWFEGYLLTEKIDEAVHLRRWLDDIAALPLETQRLKLRNRIEQLAALIQNLHGRNLSQRDLKASNILVGGEKLWFIDLVGITSHRYLSRARRMQNLARLNASFIAHPSVTRSDRLRFLRAYLQWGLRGNGGWKKWWRGINRLTDAKIQLNTRRARPLA